MAKIGKPAALTVACATAPDMYADGGGLYLQVTVNRCPAAGALPSGSAAITARVGCSLEDAVGSTHDGAGVAEYGIKAGSRLDDMTCFG